LQLPSQVAAAASLIDEVMAPIASSKAAIPELHVCNCFIVALHIYRHANGSFQTLLGRRSEKLSHIKIVVWRLAANQALLF
jgi:hypothetical protein